VSRARWFAVLALLAFTGCQTTRSWSDGCPGVYSGVRYFVSQQDSLPWDGKVFFTLDLPLTVVFDTLALPVTAWIEPEKPQSGWVPGCRWAD